MVGWKLQQILDELQCGYRDCTEGEKPQVGHTYYCGYWQTYYTCTGIADNGYFECKWDDGHENSHITYLDSRDKELLIGAATIHDQQGGEG